jgi:hypothetical protein
MISVRSTYPILSSLARPLPARELRNKAASKPLILLPKKQRAVYRALGRAALPEIYSTHNSPLSRPPRAHHLRFERPRVSDDCAPPAVLPFHHSAASW